MNDRSESSEVATAAVGGTRAAVAAEVMPKSGLLVLREAKIPVPTEAEIESKALQATEKFVALAEMAQDPSLSAEMQAKVQNLLALATPVKPGMEEVDTRWSVARVNMAQPTSQAAAKPEAARPGDLYTSAGALLDKSFTFIPLHFNEENIMFLEGKRAPECAAPDAKLGQPYGLCKDCRFLPFGKQNGGRGEQQATDCQNQIVVAALAADLSQVYLLSFAKTSRKAGSALVALARQQPYPWKQSYRLSTERGRADLGVYYVLKVEPTGKDNPPEVIRLAQALSELYSANRKKFLAEWYVRAASAPMLNTAPNVPSEASTLRTAAFPI